MLRRLRLVAGGAVLALLTFYFLDFTGDLSLGWTILARMQFVPAVLGFGIGMVAAILAATFLFGRVYCSVICPLGVMQDVLARFGRFGRRGKRYCFSPAKKKTRLAFLFAAGVGFVGFATILSLLDPYSIFGRTVTELLSPVWRLGNNLLATHFPSLRLYRVPIFYGTVAAFRTAAVMFACVAIAAVFRGRWWCNVLCPVGTLLGFVSRFSFGRVRLDKTACISCGVCERKCKAESLDAKNKTLDGSRCVTCFNCLDGCPKNAIRWGFFDTKPTAHVAVMSPELRDSSHDLLSDSLHHSVAVKGINVDSSKRLFLVTFAVGVASLVGKFFRTPPVAAAAPTSGEHSPGLIPYEIPIPVMPPGARIRRHFQHHCTACHLCVSKCPTRCLRPAFLEYGLGGFLQPTMKFDRPEQFCNFDCTVCGDVCPTKAILPRTKDEKHVTQIGVVKFLRENCIVVTDGTSCGACAEHCPTGALHMVPYRDALTIPEIVETQCVGCGACESICPTRPYRAVHVSGLERQQVAERPPVAEQKRVELDDFGF